MCLAFAPSTSPDLLSLAEVSSTAPLPGQPLDQRTLPNTPLNRDSQHVGREVAVSRCRVLPCWLVAQGEFGFALLFLGEQAPTMFRQVRLWAALACLLIHLKYAWYSAAVSLCSARCNGHEPEGIGCLCHARKHMTAASDSIACTSTLPADSWFSRAGEAPGNPRHDLACLGTWHDVSKTCDWA